MQIFTQPEELRRRCRKWRDGGESIALVPTMGYYHQGHEDLMRYAREHADRVVVSLFVNPAQFGPNEDFAAYPRDFDRDCAIAGRHNIDAIFAPAPEAMYANDHSVWIEPGELGKGLCGASRPVHFRGVCTVVLKLFMLAMPDIAVFGQKDWQQQAIIKRLVRDLNIPVHIVARPTTREKDGLAMSSRNVYLSPEERRQAPSIRKGLLLARDMVEKGERDPENLRQALLEFWAEHMPGARIDYLSIVHPETLEPLESINDATLVACAAFFGKARLIDNILITNA